MNRSPVAGMPTCLLLFAVPLSAADLKQIDRKISREPAYKSKPKYCLLVFGLKARTRVWLVLDPDARLLYVDRNGNGNLTEKGERVEPNEKSIDIRRYQAGDILAADGKTKYTNLSVVHVGTEKGAEGLELAEGFTISVEVKGVAQQVQLNSFASRPQDAPVLHFDGPLTLGLGDPENQVLAIGKTPVEVFVWVGTVNAGRASPSVLFHQDVPKGVAPVLDIVFPNQDRDGKPIRKKYVLRQRC